MEFSQTSEFDYETYNVAFVSIFWTTFIYNVLKSELAWKSINVLNFEIENN